MKLFKWKLAREAIIWKKIHYLVKKFRKCQII
jgi:hypothetical protein